jgi:hypothetical protein
MIRDTDGLINVALIVVDASERIGRATEMDSSIRSLTIRLGLMIEIGDCV